MRISEKKVAQLIEGKRNGSGGMDNATIVIVDESTGNEVELTGDELLAVLRAARIFGVIRF